MQKVLIMLIHQLGWTRYRDNITGPAWMRSSLQWDSFHLDPIIIHHESASTWLGTDNVLLLFTQL